MKNTPLDIGKSNSHERLQLIINATGIGIWDWQVQSGELTFNDRWAEMLGYTIQELEPVNFNTWSENLHPSSLQKAQVALQKHFSGEQDVYEIELQLRHKSGKYVWVLASGKVVEWDANHQPVRMIGIHLDISERKENEESLIVTSQLLNQSQRAAKVGGWELDVLSGHLFWTDETYRIHDTSPDEFNPSVDAGVGYFLPTSQKIITQALDDAINQCIGYDLELETYTTKGRKIDVRTTCVVTQEGGKALKLTGIFQDISAQKAIQRKLQQNNVELASANAALKFSAHFDPLTRLPNRYLLADRMQDAVAKSNLNNTFFAIAFIDIDGFKNVNDTHGHEIGDGLLKATAQQLCSVLREGDTLARIGGDEFVAIIDDLTSPNDSEEILIAMLEAASTPMVVEQRILNVSASIGVTICPLDNGDPDHLLRHADQAMYFAKQKGKNCFHIFDIEKDVAIKSYNEKLNRIAQALKNEEFALYYQPKIDLRDKTVIGFEALIRWNHPDKGLVGPQYFLPEVEKNILGIDIGRWVIMTALKQLKDWQLVGCDTAISINISPMHLQHTKFIDELKVYLSQYPDYKHGSLEFEIVESSALNDVELVSNIINQSKDLGITFSIDDFGVGYSSLVYLKRLPVKCLKIDRSFVADMLIDMEDKSIIEGIIELAKVFNLTLIAEGVETPELGDELLSLGCFFAQGFGIAKPMPAAEVMHWSLAWLANPELVDSNSR